MFRKIFLAIQHELVRVFKNGTPVGDLIDTVLKPGQQNDEKLTTQLSSERTNYAEVIQKIRELVTE